MTQPRFVDTKGYQTKLKVPDQPWFIYGHPTNFNHFVKTDLVAVTDGERQYQTSSRKGHTRRSYKGDKTPSSVDATTYGYLDDPGRKVGNAIPGWSFILDDGTERRQFTTTGDVVALVAYLEKDMAKNTLLYTQGARYEIKAAANEGYVAADS